jgi:hypothetical protein
MKQRWHRLVHWMTRPESDVAIAAWRVLVAACALYIGVIGLTDRSTTMFWVDEVHGGIGTARMTFWVELLGGLNPESVRAACWLDIGCSIVLMVGVFPRLMSAVTLTTTLSLTRLAPGLASAGDALLVCALFLLAVSPHGKSLTLVHRLRSGRWIDDGRVEGYGRRLGHWQLVVMYVTTGLQKTVSSAWTPLGGGIALHGILQSPQWARFHDLPLGWMEPMLRIGSMMTWCWEIGFVVVLFKPQWRVLTAIIGVGFHIGIYALMEVGVFSMVSLAMYPVLFSGDEWRTGLRALSDAMARRRSWRSLWPSVWPWVPAVAPTPTTDSDAAPS